VTLHSDVELVAQVRAGAQEAFGELVKRHYRTCVNIATYMLNDRAEALDEVQKACWKAFIHLDQYQGEAGFITWIGRIVENQCRMALRDRKRVSFLHIDADINTEARPVFELRARGTDPEEEAISRDLRVMLRREMHRIPRSLRDVLLLRDVHELPILDVAERLNLTVPATKSRLLRARAELKARVLGQSGDGWHNRTVLTLQKPSRRLRRKWMS